MFSNQVLENVTLQRQHSFL